MSAQENKQVVLQFYKEVVNEADYSRLHDYVASDYVDHNDPTGEQGPEVIRGHMAGIRTTFPDFTMSLDMILCDGEYVVTHISCEGTHQGEWMGIKPSDRRVKVSGINIDRVEDGKIVEHWGEADTVGMLVQMGVDPFAN